MRRSFLLLARALLTLQTVLVWTLAVTRAERWLDPDGRGTGVGVVCLPWLFLVWCHADYAISLPGGGNETDAVCRAVVYLSDWCSPWLGLPWLGLPWLGLDSSRPLLLAIDSSSK
jgi:hypothetical protein